MDTVERVARAICYVNAVQANEIRKAGGSGHKALVKTDEELRASVDKIWMTSAAAARAAIEAMRDNVTDGMIEAGRRTGLPDLYLPSDDADKFRAMLDATLNEAEEK